MDSRLNKARLDQKIQDYKDLMAQQHKRANDRREAALKKLLETSASLEMKLRDLVSPRLQEVAQWFLELGFPATCEVVVAKLKDDPEKRDYYSNCILTVKNPQGEGRASYQGITVRVAADPIKNKYSVAHEHPDGLIEIDPNELTAEKLEQWIDELVETVLKSQNL